MSQIQRLNKALVLEKYFKCDCCGKEITMGYFHGSRPPAPWKSVEVKQNGFYLQEDYCPDCVKTNKPEGV